MRLEHLLSGAYAVQPHTPPKGVRGNYRLTRFSRTAFFRELDIKEKSIILGKDDSIENRRRFLIENSPIAQLVRALH